MAANRKLRVFVIFLNMCCLELLAVIFVASTWHLSDFDKFIGMPVNQNLVSFLKILMLGYAKQINTNTGIL